MCVAVVVFVVVVVVVLGDGRQDMVKLRSCGVDEGWRASAKLVGSWEVIMMRTVGATSSSSWLLVAVAELLPHNSSCKMRVGEL